MRELEDSRFFEDTAVGENMERQIVQEVYADLLQICARDSEKDIERTINYDLNWRGKVTGYWRLFGKLDLNTAVRATLTDECLKKSL